MADFISNDLQKENLPPERYEAKLKLKKDEVNISFLQFKEIGGNFRLIYLVTLNVKGRRIDPQRILSPATIDMNTLEDGIYSKVSSYDSKYLILTKFDDRKAEFTFDHKKWLKDATNGMRPKTSFSKFDREFRFKINVPFEMKRGSSNYHFNDFLTKKFLDWMEENETKTKKLFAFLIPERDQKRIKTKIRSMFDWSYNEQWNYIHARMKSIYIIALLYATGSAVDKLSRSNISNSSKELFATKVERNIKTFDAKKWQKYIGTKLF